jgi:sporulation protein YlmC with PRC-barrel domain
MRKTLLFPILFVWLATASAADLAQPVELRPLDSSWMYTDRWSATEMLNAPVRTETGEPVGHVADLIVGNDGEVHTLVVELGPLFDMREKYIGVPWPDVALAQELAYVQIPEAQLRSGAYTLFNRASADRPGAARSIEWRVRGLLGDFAALLDVPRYGIVEDLLFSGAGQAEAIVVARGSGVWGTSGAFAYPWQGYRLQPSGALLLGYASGDTVALQRFDYGKLDKVSTLAGGERSAAAGGTAPSDPARVPLFGTSKAARDKREIFRWLNRDGDAAISRAEAQWRPRFAAAFDDLDTNHDGRIGVAEFERVSLALLRQ